MGMDEVAAGATPYLFGGPARPACTNCNRTTELWSNFCQFKSSGPVCPLWGDLMMLDFYKSTFCFMFDRAAPGCWATPASATCMDEGGDFQGRGLPALLEAGLASPQDLLVASFGLHHGDRQEYSALLSAFLAYYAEHAALLPKLLWQQVSAQHFDGPGGEYNGGKLPFACKTIEGYIVEGQGQLVLEPGHKDTADVLHGGWRNALADPIMRAAGVPIIQSFNDTVPLSDAHRDNGSGHECTHYCFPSAPQILL
ncbi:hypothetical protein C2E20_2256 [Micractinium conductrix]|uniref:Uncharacterized protein n=1 Tax=Micractinium conductrix TaxID=554055 RepID=A0A2P6VKW3_9CHLO|nr:hypothetical protein C2E20_2256 [Micractinium conductrix]|eukprot:PSC74746.1 hypothetical protein C2E20_2256 [Micractinium conductrix]